MYRIVSRELPHGSPYRPKGLALQQQSHTFFRSEIPFPSQISLYQAMWYIWKRPIEEIDSRICAIIHICSSCQTDKISNPPIGRVWLVSAVFGPKRSSFRSGRALAASATPRRHRESRNPITCFQLHCIAYVLMTVKLYLWRSKSVYLLRSKSHSIFSPQSITAVCTLLVDASMNA